MSDNSEVGSISIITPRVRPAVTFGFTERVRTGCGNLYVTVNEDEKGLCEVFVQLGKSGGCGFAQCQTIGMLLSASLRAGIDPSSLVRKLRGVRCHQPGFMDGEEISSCADGIGRVIERYLSEHKKGESCDGISEDQAASS